MDVHDPELWDEQPELDELHRLGRQPDPGQFWGSSSEFNSATTLGLFAQDQWNLGRLTVNAGARFDNPRTGYPDQVRPKTKWVTQEFKIPAKTLGYWYDIQPRLGAAYDLFGTGKTALKASISRYGKRESTDWGQLTNPVIVNRTDEPHVPRQRVHRHHASSASPATASSRAIR